MSVAMKFSKIQLLLFSFASGIILSLGWPERGFPGFLFIGLVPLLMIEEFLYLHRDKFMHFSVLIYSYPGFFVWNLLTTWWICNSTLLGAIMAIVLNSLFMAIVFQGFHWVRKQLHFRVISFLALISFWISFEYLHLNWDLNWPWLNLGNGFASCYKWVQWYEYTGALGGTIWVLAGNILAFELVREITKAAREKRMHEIHLKRPIILYTAILLTWILLPIGISYIIYHNYKEEKRPVRFVVVQPNVDPYSEQYDLPPSIIIGRIMALAGREVNDSTNFLVAPESAIQENIWENDLRTFSSIRMLRKEIEKHPQLNLLIGGSTFYAFAPGEKLPRTARKFSDVNHFYNAYNAAIMINSRDSLQLYHKSKLTPGVEILPSFKGFGWLEKYAIDLGGTVGSLGTDSIRKVYSTVNTVKVGPAICYESIFGEFFSLFVRNGAEIMIIITNDGWWGNTAGYRQHFSFAHLRAIETRRSIARSANTGISAFIDQRGDAFQATAYWKPAVIKGTLNANSRITFYVSHGDYLARLMVYLGTLLFAMAFILYVKKRVKQFSGR